MSVNNIFSLLRKAVKENKLDTVRFLLKQIPPITHEFAMEEGERLCMMAFGSGHADVLKEISESSAFSKCFIPEADSTSDVCLEIAKAQHKQRENLCRDMSRAVCQNDIKAFWRLLQREDANPNAEWGGETLCSLAAKKGHAEILNILCCFGADFEARSWGSKPIDIAANDACKAVLYRHMAAAVEKKSRDLALSEARPDLQSRDPPSYLQLREFDPHQMRQNATCAIYGDAASGKSTLVFDLLQYNPAIVREQAPISSCILVDYVFLFYNDSIFKRKKLFQYLGAVFGTFEIFEQVMETTKRDYNCVVIDNACKSKNISDCVFWYKAKCQKQVAIEKKKAKEAKGNIAIAMCLISKCLKRGDRHFYVSRAGDFAWTVKFDSMTKFSDVHGADWTDALLSKKPFFEQLMEEDDFDLSVTESDKNVKQAIDSIIESAGYFDITEIAHGNHPTIWGINGGVGPGQTSWKDAVIACANIGKSSQVEPPPETVESLVEQALAKHGSIFITKSDDGKRWGISKKPEEPPQMQHYDNSTLLDSLHDYIDRVRFCETYYLDE